MIRKVNLTPGVDRHRSRLLQVRNESGWIVDREIGDPTKTNILVRSLKASGYQARSIPDPRNGLTRIQLEMLLRLHARVPSRWRNVIRLFWSGHTYKSGVSSILDRDQIRTLRLMRDSHGNKWLKQFSFKFLK